MVKSAIYISIITLAFALYPAPCPAASAVPDTVARLTPTATGETIPAIADASIDTEPAETASDKYFIEKYLEKYRRKVLIVLGIIFIIVVVWSFSGKFRRRRPGYARRFH